MGQTHLQGLTLNQITPIHLDHLVMEPLIAALVEHLEPLAIPHKRTKTSQIKTHLEPLAREPLAREPLAMEPLAMEPLAMALLEKTMLQTKMQTSQIKMMREPLVLEKPLTKENGLLEALLETIKTSPPNQLKTNF